MQEVGTVLDKTFDQTRLQLTVSNGYLVPNKLKSE